MTDNIIGSDFIPFYLRSVSRGLSYSIRTHYKLVILGSSLYCPMAVNECFAGCLGARRGGRDVVLARWVADVRLMQPWKHQNTHQIYLYMFYVLTWWMTCGCRTKRVSCPGCEYHCLCTVVFHVLTEFENYATMNREPVKRFQKWDWNGNNRGDRVTTLAKQFWTHWMFRISLHAIL